MLVPHRFETANRAVSANLLHLEQVLGSGVYLALEELFVALEDSREALLSNHETASLAGLVSRAMAELEAGVQCLRTGLLAQISDVTRVVMEGEYLFEDFAEEEGRMVLWLATDPKERWKEFAPAKLRGRKARRLGVSQDELMANSEYSCHCSGSHFGDSTDWSVERGLEVEPRQPDITISIGELLVHGKRFFFSVQGLLKVRGLPIISEEELRDRWINFREQHERVYFMLEVLRQLHGRNYEDSISQAMPEDGSIDMMALMRTVKAREIVQNIKAESKSKSTEA